VKTIKLLCAIFALAAACTAQAQGPTGFYAGFYAGAESFRGEVKRGVRREPSRHNVVNRVDDDEMGGLFGLRVGFSKMYPKSSRDVGFDRAGFLAGEIDVSVGHASVLGDATALTAPTTTTTAQERLDVSAVVEDTLDLDRGVMAGGSVLMGAQFGKGILYLKFGAAALDMEHFGYRAGIGYLKPLGKPWALRTEFVYHTFSGASDETFDKATLGAFQIGLVRYFGG